MSPGPEFSVMQYITTYIYKYITRRHFISSFAQKIPSHKQYAKREGERFLSRLINDSPSEDLLSKF